MPSPAQVVEAIANQMMKGPKPGRYAQGSTPETRALFLEKYRPLIEEVLPLLPRGSAAIGAVICKCAILYGKRRPLEFADALGNAKFQSKNDPVYLLWNYLQTQRRNNSTEHAYRMAVTACRAYCTERYTLNSLRPAKMDVFEWQALKTDCTEQIAACLPKQEG